MLPMKTFEPSKFTAELDDFLNSEFLNGSPKNNKPTKIQKADTDTAEVPNFSDTNQTGAKEKKINENIEACGELRQKSLAVKLIVMKLQLDARKQVHETILKNLSDAIEDVEADYIAFKENKQILEHLIGLIIKCKQQSTTAYQQKVKLLEELYASFKKRYYEDTDLKQRDEAEEMKKMLELAQDIFKFKEELIKENKRMGEFTKILYEDNN